MACPPALVPRLRAEAEYFALSWQSVTDLPLLTAHVLSQDLERFVGQVEQVLGVVARAGRFQCHIRTPTSTNQRRGGITRTA